MRVEIGRSGMIIDNIPVTAGLDINTVPSSNGDFEYTGPTISIGVGTPGIEFHYLQNHTKVANKFNVYDEIRNICLKIFE